MAKKFQDFEMWANDDLAIRVEDIINETTGALIQVGDILGASWALTPYNEQNPKLIEKDFTNSAQILVPADGVVLINLLATDTATLGGGKYSHQLKLLHGGGTQTACTGTVSINNQVTNNPL